MRRIGFEATTRVNRHDFGVSWQDHIPGGGVVASDEIHLVRDVEAILLEYYPEDRDRRLRWKTPQPPRRHRSRIRP